MNRRTLVRFGAVACVACSAVPLAVSVGAVASAGLVATVFVGVGAAVLAAVVIIVLVALRRRYG